MTALTPTQHRDPTGRVPVSVWLTGQQPAVRQLAYRYVPESSAYRDAMLPSIARHAIETYTEPGQIVLDPLCGIGTTVVEAAHLGRTGLGVEHDRRWATVAEQNLGFALQRGVPGKGGIWHTDPCALPPDFMDRYAGHVGLVLTTPRLTTRIHGRVNDEGRHGRRGVQGNGRFCSESQRSIAANPLAVLPRVLQNLRPLLAPDARVAIVARTQPLHGHIVDLPSVVFGAGRAAGLVPVERVVALRAEYVHEAEDGEYLVSSPSDFQLGYVRQQRACGVPLSLTVAEDVCVLAAPAQAGE